MSGVLSDTGRPAVALVSMPFFRCLMPPIGLGLLKSALAAAEIPATVYDLGLELLPEMHERAAEAVERYELLSNRFPTALVGEWLFAPKDADRDERYLALLPDCGFDEDAVGLLRRLRARVDERVEAWARRLAGRGHDVVGFTCSLGRTRANVRLAEAIRRLAPGTRIAFGGLEASGDMGRALLEAFPVVDLVCHCDADELIVPIVRGLRGDPATPLESLRGVSFRRDGRIVTQEAAPAPDLERTPAPDYEDYFREVSELRASWAADLELPAYVPVETARGCWWGDKRHCVFCSVNGDRLAFRAKSADRALAELDVLHARHGVRRFLVVDNVLHEDYFATLLPRLSRTREQGLLLEWEVRPNLGRAKAKALALAGVAWVQPGLESLSSEALRVMNKGTSAIDNVQCMKWLMAYDIQCSWNFLYSLPQEKLSWYEEVARFLPRLAHLEPPRGPHRIVVERFSPYVSRARELGVELLGPTLFARLAFDDLPEELLARLVYNFEYEFRERPKDLDRRIADLLTPLLSDWRRTFEARGCTLSLVDGPGESLLVMGPLLSPDRILRLRGPLRRLLKGCESIRPERELRARLAQGAPADCSQDAAIDANAGGEPPLEPRAYREVLAELCFTGVTPEEEPQVSPEGVIELADEQGLVFRESGRILSLPVDRTRHVRSGPFQLAAAYRRYQ